MDKRHKKKEKVFTAEDMPFETKPTREIGDTSIRLEFNANLLEFESQTKDRLVLALRLTKGPGLPDAVLEALEDHLGLAFAQVAMENIHDLQLLKHLYDARIK